jgi:hypothetical protein
MGDPTAILISPSSVVFSIYMRLSSPKGAYAGIQCWGHEAEVREMAKIVYGTAEQAAEKFLFCIRARL